MHRTDGKGNVSVDSIRRRHGKNHLVFVNDIILFVKVRPPSNKRQNN